jgi:hypothetical protein
MNRDMSWHGMCVFTLIASRGYIMSCSKANTNTIHQIKNFGPNLSTALFLKLSGRWEVLA